jgi:IS5 family transposase
VASAAAAGAAISEEGIGLVRVRARVRARARARARARTRDRVRATIRARVRVGVRAGARVRARARARVKRASAWLADAWLGPVGRLAGRAPAYSQ